MACIVILEGGLVREVTGVPDYQVIDLDYGATTDIEEIIEDLQLAVDEGLWEVAARVIEEITHRTKEVT